MNRPENNKPFYNIVSGRWRVVTIREEIGLNGYKTILDLVREKIIISEKTTSSSERTIPRKPLIE